MMHDQQIKYEIVKWLEAERGLKPCGRVACGNPCTMQQVGKGWAAAVTFYRPDNPNIQVEDNE